MIKFDTRVFIIFKLKQNGISGELLSVFSDFSKDRKQKVTLKAKVSSWADVNAGVPQGSIFGPLPFLVYINDLADGPIIKYDMFADDIPLFLVIHDVDTFADELINDLCQIN